MNIYLGRIELHKKVDGQKGTKFEFPGYRAAVAPRPNFVFFILAVRGASSPPDRPIRSPSAQPIEANILNPMLVSPIFGAAYNDAYELSEYE